MHKTLILAAIAALAFSSVAEAKTCKDASGKFTKCPVAAAPAKTAPCKDAKGKFTKCPTTTAVATTTKTSGGLFGPKKTTTAVATTTTTGGATTTTTAAGGPHCTKGKPCGKSCIAMDKVCHK